MTTATIQTLDTPDGAFTILADDEGRVLASGWTADADAILARLSARVRPSSVEKGETDAASAVTAYYAGAEKAEATQRAWAFDGDVHETPARGISGPSVTWYVDEAAAGLQEPLRTQ